MNLQLLDSQIRIRLIVDKGSTYRFDFFGKHLFSSLLPLIALVVGFLCYGTFLSIHSYSLYQTYADPITIL